MPHASRPDVSPDDADPDPATAGAPDPAPAPAIDRRILDVVGDWLGDRLDDWLFK